MLNKALADAHRKGLVVRNVASIADPPSVSARRREDIKAWDADQLRTFLDAHRVASDSVPAFHLVGPHRHAPRRDPRPALG